MKKLITLTVALIALILQTTMVACSSNDDNNETEEPKVSQFKYSFSLNEDIINVADVKINYIDTDGNEHSETLNATSWSKTFTADKFDVSAGVAISMTLKNGVELTKESYRIEYVFNYSAVSTKNGTKVDSWGSSPTFGGAVGAADVQKMLADKSGSTALKIDAEGKVSTTTLSWQDNGVHGDLELIPFI